MTKAAGKSSFARTALATFAIVLALGAGIAEAQRAGGGRSQGSRGSQSFNPPPPTATAPGATQGLNRTTQQPAVAPRPGAPAPAAAAAAQAAKPSMGRSLMMGLAGGLLGAGLFGLLSGSGLFGGMGGIASFLGLLLQVALIGGVVWFVLRMIRGRKEQQPAMSTPGMAPGAPQYEQPANGGVQRMADAAPAMGGVGGGMAAGYGAQQAPVAQPLQISGEDFNQFERGLYDVQAAFGRGDVGALRTLATPEMAAYFEQDIADYKAKNWDNRIGEVKLLQGDLSEAWSEQDGDYATVAMRYSILAATMDRASGKIIQGDAMKPEEVTELWTFRRERGYDPRWKLAAIQQPEPAPQTARSF